MQIREKKYIFWHLPSTRSKQDMWKHEMESIVNGRPNSKVSKVAKFLDV